jgi:hypothetical protein
MAELNEYVVLADAVNVTTGYNGKGEPIVARLERTDTINAPADHESIVDLLSMGGIALKKTAVADMKGLAKQSNRHRPTMQKVGPEGNQTLRITAAGTAFMIGGGDVPEAALDDVVPTHAPLPDLSVGLAEA